MNADTSWPFVTRLYARPGVAERCVGLQDRHGVDVTLLLFCCWAGARARTLSPAELSAARAATERWQRDVTGTLRALRRRLKHDACGVRADRRDAFRKQLQAVEISAERVALLTLSETVAGCAATAAAAGGRAAVAVNVEACLRGYGVARDDARRDAEWLAERCAAPAP